VGFIRRRLRFVVAALNWWYRTVGTGGFPTREELDEGKRALYEQIATLDAVSHLRSDADGAEALRTLVRSAFDERGLTDFITRHGPNGKLFTHENQKALDDLFAQAMPFFTAQLAGVAPATLSAFARIAADWAPARRRDLVVRYLGFPIWDVLIYPVQSLSQTGEGDAIEVVRVSPRESDLLPVPKNGKVEGTGFHHFYAFFHREARENDYLWGRLDAAEQLVRLLVDSAGGKDGEVRPWAKQLFAAVLDEEEQALTTIRTKVEGLRADVAKL